MKILLTNDDSISSPGIQLLAIGLREAGHRVFVIAPSYNRSGVSHSISFINGPCKITEIEKDTWYCDGTPADCVVLGLLGGIPEMGTPDAIVSGINRGANLGTDLLYSGTAAAARQGAVHKIPSLALSLHEGLVWNWEMAVIFAVEHLGEMLSYWKPDTFININIPNQQQIPSGLVHAFPSLRYYNDSIEVYNAPDGNRYCFCKTGVTSAKPEKGSDWEAVKNGNVSLSEIFIHPVLLESVRGKGEAE